MSNNPVAWFYCYIMDKACWGILWICDIDMKKGNELENINKTVALEDWANDELSTQTASTFGVYVTVLVWQNLL